MSLTAFLAKNALKVENVKFAECEAILFRSDKKRWNKTIRQPAS